MGNKKKTSKNMHTRSQVESNAILRFKQACDDLVGEGYFSHFTKGCHQRLLANRLDAVKLKIKVDKADEKPGAKFFEDIFREHLNVTNFTTLTGKEMPVNLFLREGLGLIFYVEAMKNEEIVHGEKLIPVFTPYFTDSDQDILKHGIAKVLTIMLKLSSIMSDWSKWLFVYTLNELGAYTEIPNINQIPGEFQKPESLVIKIDGTSREIIRLCWSDIQGGFEYADVLPAAIGLDAGKVNSPVPVYIQRHALQRLKERLGMVPGIVHHEIFELFVDGNYVYHVKDNGDSLVEFFMLEKKLGYLYCSFVDNKVVIRSFLFLTNDGTPEGKRLSKLTQLQKLDKRYLEIDTLAGFLGVNIAADPELSDLFTEAGCGDLLDSKLLKIYMNNDVKEKDVLTLMKYLTGRDKEKKVLEV